MSGYIRQYVCSWHLWPLEPLARCLILLPITSALPKGLNTSSGLLTHSRRACNSCHSYLHARLSLNQLAVAYSERLLSKLTVDPICQDPKLPLVRHCVT